ncbi:uncharacterized protein LOC123503837 [Portunus trituberculatus]|uniref:uncharacterized protein LOC123503837 n=1 Tax=Portunus trituberculatus TaxID=210409 RepID=UPI001E1CB5A7|nr:uncharacterized protein LOC123503837 [Portunus trituberculatus]
MTLARHDIAPHPRQASLSQSLIFIAERLVCSCHTTMGTLRQLHRRPPPDTPPQRRHLHYRHLHTPPSPPRHLPATFTTPSAPPPPSPPFTNRDQYGKLATSNGGRGREGVRVGRAGETIVSGVLDGEQHTRSQRHL